MPLHWRPVGPETEQTYWQRRAAVALAVLVPLALLLSLLGGGDDEFATPRQGASASPSLAPSPDPSAVPSAGPGPSASPGASLDPSASPDPSPDPSASPSGEACADTDLEISAAATGNSYPAGGAVPLELSIRNAAATPCDRDLGQAAVELLVYSGDDRIWSSDDCAPGGGGDVTTLAPGAAEVSRVTWSGGRSRPGCEPGLEQARPGTYRVTARVGELRVEGDSFQLQ